MTDQATRTTITLSASDLAVLVSAIDAEIEHIGDYVRETDDRDEIVRERKREEVLEAIRAQLV